MSKKCERHGIDVDKLPDDYQRCPRCVQEEGEAEVQVEKAARDRQMEPW